MQRVVNYGSFLQAYALKRTLQGLGGDVSFVDILPGKPLPGFEWDRAARVRSAVTNAFRALRHGRFLQRVRSRLFVERLRRQFASHFYSMLESGSSRPPEYDLVVIGSDEVFNVAQQVTWGFSPQLFGAGLPAKRVVSYAGSFGNTTLRDIEMHGLRNSIAAALSHLSHISVRDGNSSDIIKELIGEDAELHLDPVLTFDWAPVLSGTPARDDAIIVYAYPNRITNEEARRIRCLARKRRKRLVSIGAHYEWCDEVLLPQTPFEVLAHFSSADSVLTDTFHGAIFAIVCRRRFGVLVRPLNQAKLGYMLSQLHLESNIALKPSDIEERMSREVDYAPAFAVIEEKRRSASAYWTKCLDGLS